jgi:hypothetical protein
MDELSCIDALSGYLLAFIVLSLKTTMGRTGKIHFMCLALALLDMFLYFSSGISFRGQWFDILLSIAPIVTASNVLFNRFKRLNTAGKIYFVAMPVINLLLTPLYLFGTICFPLDTVAEAKNYEARERPGVLSPQAVNLIKKTFIFERLLSENIYYETEHSPESHVRIVFKGDSVGVSVPRYEEQDTTFFFRK